MKSCEQARKEKIHLNFIVDDIYWKGILSDCFSSSSRYDVSFYSFDECKALDKIESFDKICLIFEIQPDWRRGEKLEGGDRSFFNREEIDKLLYEKSQGMIIAFEVTDQKSAEQSDVVTDWFERHGKKHVYSIAILPQGINNTLQPKRKAFVMYRLDHIDEINIEAANKFKTYVTKYLLVRSFNRQMIILSSHSSIVKNWNPDQSQPLSSNVRKEYADATYGKRLTDRTRNEAQRYDFSPELTIRTNWHIDERGLKRVEAYFTRDEVKGKSKRGIIIKESKKRKVFSEGEDIEHWILTEYPFSEIKYRKSSKDNNLSKNPGFSDVQSSVIAAFEGKFDEENISIKTIWYLYPDVKDTMSEKDYQILKELILIPEIGFLMVQDIESEKVTELLQTYFPDDTQEVLKRRFRALSDLVSFAQRIGFCQKNDLKETLLDRNKNDRLFGQVRRALAKRHFTKIEQKLFYDAAYKAYFDGDMEYLGVLLRLLTGQADNVVCAFKWKDLIHVNSLKLYYFIETRQITNDGKTIKALEDQKDYICFPCSDLMEQLLLRQRDKIQNAVGKETDIRELPVVISKECLENYQKQISFYPPTKLAKLEKDLLQEIGIKENVISVPTNDDRGTKDTNLNRYMGDFFRENFRYWSSNFAQMSADEVAYALGSTQPSTVGHYYIEPNHAPCA